MALSRRSFVRLAGLTGAGLASPPLLAGAGLRAAGPSAAPAQARGVIQLSGNENPYGLGPAARAAIERTLPVAARYGRNTGPLLRLIAARHGVDRDWVLLSAGSGDLLRAAVEAFTSPQRALVHPEPTFEPPVELARRSGHPVRAVRVTGELGLDLPAMAAASGGAGLIYVCNPNNPTSTAVPLPALRALVKAVADRSPDAIVLADEAYADYAEPDAFGSVLDLAREQPRVIVVRTFSKIFAMAGLRVGYAIGHPSTLARLDARLPVMTMSVLSIAAATAALEDREHYAQQVALNRETRARTAAALAARGCRVARSQANFVMADVGRPVGEFASACARAGVQIGRPFPPLDTWARITIGTADEMTQAIAVFDAVLKPGSGA